VSDPVERFLAHAGGSPVESVRLTMSGRIKVGLWLPFVAEQALGRDRFVWTARVARVLTVTDAYADGAGRTEGRLGGRRLFGAADEDVTRSAAGRTALEAVTFAPACLHGVGWRTQDDEHIVATWEIPPERPEVHVRLGAEGAPREVWAQRWRKGGYARCACTVHAERTFGAFTVPSRISVGWEDAGPFLHAEIRSLAAQ
jgi:uncharacterized protein DUF6544